MKRLCIALLVFLSVFLVMGCGGNREPESKKNTQSQKAQQAADSIQFTANAEIDNIKRRLVLTSNPGQIGFVLLMNEAGQPIWYGGVKGKVTSGGKRLTSPQKLTRGDRGSAYGDFVMVSPSDEGTWGSSNPYVYFWTTDGQYIQWSGHYLYSDKPFRLKVKPLAVTIVPAKTKIKAKAKK